MFFGYFTEQPYSVLSLEEALKAHPFDHPARRPGDNVLLHSNRFFDSEVGARLYGEHLSDYILADELGFDGLMLNEHHNAPFCMSTRINIIAAALATRTRRAKLLMLGNPLPLWENPVQLAEELALIDMISGGRLISGIVRGGGQEQLANNINPAFNRARFSEAHDLLVKAWTVPGPWRWEGDHYHLRVVNPWALPLQKPHPPIWVPGISSMETIDFAAARGYPYIALNTALEETKKIWERYDSVAAANGYPGGSPYHGYLMKCQVAHTEEKAIENARHFMWMKGAFTGTAHPVWASPTGYSNIAGTKARKKAHARGTFEQQLENDSIIAGTPSQVIEKIRRWMEETRPGMLMLWLNDGTISHDRAQESLSLMAREVLPALREIGKELGLKSALDAGAGISHAARHDARTSWANSQGNNARESVV